MDKHDLQEKRLKLLEMLRLVRMAESGIWKNALALRYARFCGVAFIVILAATLWYAFEASDNFDGFVGIVVPIFCGAGFIFLCAALAIKRGTVNETSWDEMLSTAIESYTPLQDKLWCAVYEQADSEGNIPLEVIKVWVSHELNEADRLYEEATARKIKLPLVELVSKSRNNTDPHF